MTLSSTVLERGNVAGAADHLYVVLSKFVRLGRRQAREGLAPGQLSVLSTITREGPMRLGELAARENVAAPTLTRIVAGLERLSFVSRELDRTDRRGVVVKATTRGRRALEETREGRTAALRERLDRLEPQELATVLEAVALLERITVDV